MAGLRLLHTADVHLGAPFGFLGRRGREQRSQIGSTFSGVVDLALTSQVDAVLIAGDLFDTAYPDVAAAGEVLYQFRRLDAEAVWMLVVPGTHDRLEPGGVYDGKEFAALAHLHVFREKEITPFRIDSLGLTVYGRATAVEGRDVLAGFHALNDTLWHVGMLHASFTVPGRIEKDEMMVTGESISRSGLDYLALGHWHNLSDYSQGGVPAFYSGSPEPLEMGKGEEGRVLLVDLEEGSPPRIRPIAVGRRRLQRAELAAHALGGPAELYACLRRMADRDLALDVRVSGVWGEEWAGFDREKMEEDLSPLFFHFRLEAETGELSGRDIEAFPEKTVIGRFVRLARREIARRQGEDALVAEEALRLGLAHLAGRAGGK